VTEGPLNLTELDRDILTELYRTGKVTVAGVDPRVSVSRIARRLRTSRARIAARIRAWEQAGLMRGYDVWPNPTLFGLAGGSVDVRLRDRLRKPEMFERFALVDGAVGGLEYLGDWVSIQLVAPDVATLERRVRLLAGLDGVAEVGPLLSWATLEVARGLSPLEVRIIRALRQDPQASLAQTATAVGVSARTMTDRYAALLDEDLVWYVPAYDFTTLASPIVNFNLELASPDVRGAVLKLLRSRIPWFLEFGWSGFGPVFSPLRLSIFVFAPSSAGVEGIERAVRDVPGVASAEANILVRVVSFPHAFESVLALPASPDAPTPANHRPRKHAPTGPGR
jgi:DNA-binding Lrp family transcriptional regulator